MWFYSLKNVENLFQLLPCSLESYIVHLILKSVYNLSFALVYSHDSSIKK